MRWWVALAAVALAAAPAHGARPTAQPSASSEMSSPAPQEQAPPIYLVTLGQGDQIWERFGHNFLALPDSTGRMVAYNWGVFDFAAPDFLSRFLLGDTRYWMEAVDLERVIQFYRQHDRSITLQRLRLEPDQVDSLQTFLAWNARPENRYYRYDYFRDNCSTRLRDALDLALGGALRRATDHQLTNLTYRNETLRLVDEQDAAQLGVDVALGPRADVLLSQWGAMFVPMRMQEYVRSIRVPTAAGDSVPLVVEERVVHRARRAPEATRAPSMVAELSFIGIALAAVIVLLTRAVLTGKAKAATLLGAIAGVWGGITGTIGIVLLLAWTMTQHVFWYRNENLFQLNPVALALLVLVPLAMSRPRWWPAARAVAYVVAGLSILGGVLKIFPWMLQSNWAIVMLALPVNVALAWAVTRISRTAGGVGRGSR